MRPTTFMSICCGTSVFRADCGPEFDTRAHCLHCSHLPCSVRAVLTTWVWLIRSSVRRTSLQSPATRLAGRKRTPSSSSSMATSPAEHPMFRKRRRLWMDGGFHCSPRSKCVSCFHQHSFFHDVDLTGAYVLHISRIKCDSGVRQQPPARTTALPSMFCVACGAR